jgi:hypothetical protein
MKQLYLVVAIILTTTLLSGCLYPNEKIQQNQIPYDSQLKSVQEAVDKFQEQNGGILPIKTKDQATPIYQKYPIDFNRLTAELLPEPPGNAYESGGIFQYVLINVEKKPEVKIFDLRMAEQIKEIQIRIQSQGYPPFKKSIGHNLYSLDYSKLGYKEEPTVVSPYSQKNLPLVIAGDGNIYVDYSYDLYEVLKNRKPTIKKGTDIRSILTEKSPFVPAYSLPYTIDDKGEPVFLVKD